MVVAVKSSVTGYAEAVQAGEIIAGRLVRLACERHLGDLATGSARRLRFDEGAAQRAIDFFSYLRHSKGEWAGREFVLGPWQQFIIGSLFGWVREHGRCGQCDTWLPLSLDSDTIACEGCFAGEDSQAPAEMGWLRRFRTAYNEIARKNGKSTLAAGVGILLAFFDDEAGAEVYTAATKRDQAKIIWSEAQRMVRRSPDLSNVISVYVGNLSDRETASKFEPIGSDEDSTDGLNIHGNIVDELHAHKTRKLWEVLETAMGARRQPMTFVVTTAGFDRETICWEQRQYGVDVLEGVAEDDSYFAYIATIDEGDDWRDRRVWVKANPNLGVSIKFDYLDSQCRQAEQVPARQIAVKQRHFDIWTQQHSAWIDLDLWAEQAGTIDEVKLKGKECFGGLDLGAVDDLSAWLLIFPGKDDLIEVLAHFWCPEARLHDPTNRYRSQYQQWAADGYLTTVPEAATMYGPILKRILADARRFELTDLNMDWSFQGRDFGRRLSDDLGPGQTGEERVLAMRQGFLSMGPPMKELTRRVLLKKIRHGGNPILRWMVEHAVVIQDTSDNQKFDKRTAQTKIDGLVALVMAIERLTLHEPEEEIRFYA